MTISRARGAIRASIAGLLLVAAPATAEVLRFQAVLTGKADPDKTGSDATGQARIRIDTAHGLVSVKMRVRGITIDQLWKRLVAAPIGPVHFHEYRPDGDSVLALPLPYGAGYRPTRDGFRIVSRDYDYAAGARLLRSTLSFDDFVAAMKAGRIILNIHTDRFNLGEIGGTVVPG